MVRVVDVLRLRRRNQVSLETHSTRALAKRAYDAIAEAGAGGITHEELAAKLGVSVHHLYPGVKPLLQDDLIVIRGERGNYCISDTEPVDYVRVLTLLTILYWVLPLTFLPIYLQRILFTSVAVFIGLVIYYDERQLQAIA